MKGYLGYKLLLFVHCSHKGMQYQALLSNVTLETSNGVEHLLNFLRNGISFQVLKPSCQQLNVQVEESVCTAKVSHLDAHLFLITDLSQSHQHTLDHIECSVYHRKHSMMNWLVAHRVEFCRFYQLNCF